MRQTAALALIATLLATASSAHAGEQLLVPEMSGWKVIATHNDGVADVSELIPNAETPDTWTQRLSIQAFKGAPMSATAFLEQLPMRISDVCDGATAEAVRPVTMEDLDAGRRGIACSRFKGDGKGSYTLYYAIRGRDALYVLARGWRGTPFTAGSSPVPAAELASWNSTFDAVRLCDSTDPKRPCSH